MDTKTTGYLFLGFGVFIMTFSLVLIILAFTNIIKPSYFKTSSLTTQFKSTNQAEPQLDINSIASGGKLNISDIMPSFNVIPPGVLDSALNLSAHFFLMTFIGGFGYKLAMIGTNLIRPIVIKTPHEVYETSLTPKT